METQRSELLRQLPWHGWGHEPVPEDELEWWADEMWVLSSRRSPAGREAYVTFLVDPMEVSPQRKKGQRVWAVMASADRPRDRLHAGSHYTLSLNRGWKERLPEFFDFLASLRAGGESTDQ